MVPNINPKASMIAIEKNSGSRDSMSGINPNTVVTVVIRIGLKRKSWALKTAAYGSGPATWSVSI